MYFEMACIVPQTVLSCRKWGVTSATAAAYLLTYLQFPLFYWPTSTELL